MKYIHSIDGNPQVFLRGLSKPHGVITFAHNLFASAIHELSEPADAAHEEAGIDIEEDYSRVAVGIFPVGKKRRLGKRERKDETWSQKIFIQCTGLPNEPKLSKVTWICW